MTARELLPEACSAIRHVVSAAADVAPQTPSPSHGDVQGLTRHFVGTTGAFVRAGSGALDRSDPWGSNVTVTDWAAELSANLEAIPSAWAHADSWAGTVATGSGEMPAQAIGEMALIEIVLHGWDLARATGQQLEVSDALAAEVLRAVSETAEQGRQFEAYGTEVEIAADASDLDRALGLSGRDPAWTP